MIFNKIDTISVYREIVFVCTVTQLPFDSVSVGNARPRQHRGHVQPTALQQKSVQLANSGTHFFLSITIQLELKYTKINRSHWCRHR